MGSVAGNLRSYLYWALGITHQSSSRFCSRRPRHYSKPSNWASIQWVQEKLAKPKGSIQDKKAYLVWRDNSVSFPSLLW